MDKIFLVILLTLHLLSYGQKEAYTPFKLIILRPDTARIDKSLCGDIDSIEIAHLKSYYQCKKGNGVFEKDFQSLKTWTQIEAIIQNASFIDLPKDVRQFKFFHVLSEYSAQIYESYFNQKQPHSEILELPNQLTDLNALLKLSDTEKADYVVFFNDVHTVIMDSLPVLKFTTRLYSRQENKLILEKDVVANSKNTVNDLEESSIMWNCNPNIKLQCLLINGVRASTSLVSEILLHRKAKQ